MELTLIDKLQRLEACRKIRNIAAQTCLNTLQQTLHKPHKVSEIHFKNRWYKELEKAYHKGYIGNWYDSPPSGIAVLFGEENNFKRVNYPNLRPKEYWPQSDIYLKKDGLGYLFASPYTLVENIPIIGDFGFTFYTGNSEVIKSHYKRCYAVLQELIGNIQIGMKFKDLYKQFIKVIENNGLKNFIFGTTDKVKTDLGHTIPFTDRNPDEKEMNNINSSEPERINTTISKARIFSNEFEEYTVTENCAFTFEPRFISEEKKLPMFSLHTIIQFVEGKQVILKNFNGIFKLLGMDWLTN